MKKISIIFCLFFIICSDFVYCQNEIKILDKKKVIYYPKALINVNKEHVTLFNVMFIDRREKQIASAIEKYKNEYLSITLLHNAEGEKKKFSYDVYIINKKGIQINYVVFFNCGGPGFGAERAIKGIEVFINNDTTILSIPIIKSYTSTVKSYGNRDRDRDRSRVRGRDSGRDIEAISYYCLNFKREKYKLYVTYKDEYKTYYSDTIPLYVW